MKTFLLELLFSWVQKSLVKTAKVKSLVIYLKILSATRRGLLTVLLAIFSMQLLVFVFLTLLGIGIYFLPQDTDVKLMILAGLLGFVFIAAIGLLVWLFSEKTWLKKSGAQELINELNQ